MIMFKISDYRGKKGLWTLERKRQKLEKTGKVVLPKKEEKEDKIWFPTRTHMVLKGLMDKGTVDLTLLTKIRYCQVYYYPKLRQFA
jgi:hypothetical protein